MNLHRRAFATLLVAFASLARGGRVLAQTVEALETVKVKIDQRTSIFVPASLTIKAGQTVAWTNSSFVIHSVDFDPALSKLGNVSLPTGVAPFASGNLDEGQTFAHTFVVKGAYRYVCRLHENMGMTGTIIVT